MLFAANVISYFNRQTMSVGAPVIAKEYDSTNEQVRRILAPFLLANIFGQLPVGKFLGRVGSRTEIAVSIPFWPLANTLTAPAT